ncbi:MAG: adenylate/guanylate cyclase domain-containing protein [Solirubrobacteraceae bacterium]
MDRVLVSPARVFGGNDDNELLGAYVPTLVLEWLRDRPAERHRVLDCTLVFADISGFTRMTEMLAVRGRIGAEEMADLINATFTPLLTTAYAYGAGLIKWGGDAALLLFQGAGHAARGCHAAHEMQQVMRATGSRRTSRGPVRLRMSVGVHSGVCDFFLLGHDDHRDLVAAGPAVTTLAQMEKVAGPGQIVVSEGTAAGLAAGGIRRPSTPLADGWLLRRALEAPTRSALVQPLDFSGLDPGRALCRNLREHVLGRGLASEHRHAAVGFLRFSGVDRLLAEHGPAATQTALDHVITTLQSAAAANEVTYIGADIGADGGKVLLSAGTPRRVGRDEDRMIATLRSALDAAGQLPLGAGATSGRVFSGDYGPAYRRAYSLMGDCVNLAARLTQHAASGQLLATRELVANSSGSFAVTEQAPFAAKGKRAPVHALSIGTPIAAGDRFDRAPFRGRDEELSTLLGATRAAADGVGQVVEVSGESGIGKSRLLTELEAAADAEVLRMDGDVYAVTRPYAPFERLLRNRWEIPADAAPAELAARLAQVVAERAPHLSRWLPLIAVVAGAEVQSTREVDELDPALRKQKLEEVTSELLGVLLPGARILIFNDVHLMDAASRDLIARLAADAASRWWLLVVSRTPDTPSPLREPPDERIELGALGAEVVAEMLAQATADAPLPPQRLAELARGAGGNPLFVRELVAQLQQGADPDALPRSAEGAITMRIDRLSSADRHTLRSAAVLGMEVEVPLLRQVLAADGEPWDDEPLVRLSEFLQPIAPDRYCFTHQLVRTVTYEGLPYRRRAELHSRTAAAIERAAGEQANRHAELLSMHCFHGGRFAPAYAYARLAAQRARARYANAEAAESYRRALASAARLAHADTLVLAEVEEALAEIYVERGEMTAADLTLRRALRRVRDTPIQLARLQLKVAGLRETEARFRAAFRWADQAERTLAGRSGSEVQVIRGQLATRRARLNYRRARYDEAMSCANVAIALSGDDDRPTLAEALEYADLCAVELGLVAGTRAERALAIHEERGDLAAQARVQNTLGMLAYHRGEWPRALEHYEASEQADIRCGKLWNSATPAANRAEILADQGRLEEARLALERAMLTWRGVNAVSMIAFGDYQLGRIAARRGHTEEAMRHFDVSRRHFSELGELTEVVVVDALRAEALALAGDPRAALALADATLARAQTLGGVSAMTPLLHRVRGASLQELAQPGAAERAVRQALDAARSRIARHEIAFALAALIDGEMAHDDAEEAQWSAELAQLSEELGIDPRPRWSRQVTRT